MGDGRWEMGDGWGTWIRTRDGGTKNHCLTAWLYPNKKRLFPLYNPSQRTMQGVKRHSTFFFMFIQKNNNIYATK